MCNSASCPVRRPISGRLVDEFVRNHPLRPAPLLDPSFDEDSYPVEDFAHFVAATSEIDHV